ncbi:MAG: hypothetical protein R2822_10220 [Spirosomataceae bacterium]
MFDQSHEIERLGRIITEQALINVESYHYEFHYLTAQERYQNLLKNRPTILQKVSLQIIASYLGVSNETLNRIRAKRRFFDKMSIFWLIRTPYLCRL